MRIKNDKGITMISLTVYVVIIGIVIAILAAFKGNIDESLDSMSEYTSAVPEFNKMHMYMLDEVNLEDNKVIKRNANGTYIEFSSGNTYTFSDNKIFKNDVKIFSDVESCSFELAKENDNDVLIVNLSVNENDPVSKELKYVVNNTALAMDDPYSKIGITLTPSEVTKNNVSVTFTNNTGDQDLILKYQIGTTDGNWLDYKDTIEMTANRDVYAVLVNSRGYFSSSDIVKATVDNIDRELPNDFVMEVSSTSNSITISGSTTDKGSQGIANTNVGISGYQFILYDENNNIVEGWTDKQSLTTYTFSGLTVNTTYKVSMRAIDKAGNMKESLNQNLSVSTRELVDSSTAIGIEYTTTEVTNGVVGIHFINNSGDDTLTLKYKKDTTEGEWQTYTDQIEMAYNGSVYARLFNSTGQYKNEAEAIVDNIDMQIPDEFSLSVNKTTNSITVSGSTEDKGSPNTSSEYIGISGYQFRLKNSDGTVKTNWTTLQEDGSYTFNDLTQGTTYKVSMRAIDLAGNATEATNKDTSVTLEKVEDPEEKVVIQYSETTPTQNDVIVRLINNSSSDSLVLKYQKNSTTGNWLEYEDEEPIVMTANGIINIRLFDAIGQHTNNLVAQVGNIDREKPNTFNLNATSTINSITVNGSTTDIGSTGTFSSNTGISGYQFKLTKEDGTVITDWTTKQTGTSYTFTNLSADSVYKVGMRAVDLAGNIREATNNELQIATKATIKITSFEITGTEWNSVTCNVVTNDITVSKYDVYVNGVKNQTFTTSSKDYTFTISGLTEATDYSIYVIGTDSNNKTATSATKTFTTLAKPLEITSFEVSSVAWNSVTCNVKTNDKIMKQYDVYINGSKKETFTTTSANYNFTVSGLTASTSYNIYVKATDIDGYTKTSATKSFTTSGYPLKINSFEVSDITWNGFKATVSAGGTTISKYELYVNGSLAQSVNTSNTSYTFTITTLNELTSFSTYVIVTDNNNKTVTSSIKTGKTVAGVDNLGPKVVSLEATNVTYTSYKFIAKLQDQSDTTFVSGLKNVTFFHNGKQLHSETINLIDPKQTYQYSVIVTKLTHDTTYPVYVVVTDQKNNSVTSSTINIKTLKGTDNLPPTDIVLSAAKVTNTTFDIVVNARDVSDTDFVSGIGKYAFYQGDTLLSEQSTSSENFTLSLSGASAGSTYTFKVIVTDAAGNSAAAKTITITTTNVTGTDTKPPTNVNLTYSELASDSVKLTCTAKDVSETDYISGIYSYEIFSNDVSLTTRVSGSETFSIVVNGLQMGETYKFKMIVRDGNGNATTSNTVTVTTPVPSGTLLSSVAEPGDKVEYNGSGYTDWTVLYNDGTTVSIVSTGIPENYTMNEIQAVPLTEPYTDAKTTAAFAEYTQTLNALTTKYKNSYATSSRLIGTKMDGRPDNLEKYYYTSGIVLATTQKVPDDAYTLNSIGLLNIGTQYWLGAQVAMGIAGIDGVYGQVFRNLYVTSDGYVSNLEGNTVTIGKSITAGIRPVITLKTTLKVTGKTSSGAWKISS